MHSHYLDSLKKNRNVGLMIASFSTSETSILYNIYSNLLMSLPTFSINRYNTLQ